jgi:hypothetical protein
MQTHNNKRDSGLLRAADANYNRAKEGLRTVEDVFRFVYEDRRLTPEIKRLRHELTSIFQNKPTWKSMVAARDAVSDIGASVDSLEMSRSSADDLVLAGLGRAKESIRVLEELCKIFDPESVEPLKRLRYATYTVEKKIVRALTR